VIGTHDWTDMGIPADPAEVRETWSFLHGGIMDSGIRQQLRRALGFCPRHTWLYAVVEIELWEGGAGSSPGHQPFDVCVLYLDLLGVVLDRLRSRWWHPGAAPSRALQARAGCRVCEAIAHKDQRAGWGFGGSDPSALSREVNALAHTRRWLEDTAAIWHAAICEHCAGPGARRARGSLTCRRHLIESDSADRMDVMARLAEQRVRLDGLLRSMHAGASSEATDSQRASWIETLGFFAGWPSPLVRAAATSHVSGGRGQ
jgi:hypothetical protein